MVDPVLLKPAAKATLVSEVFVATSYYHLKFYYYLNGGSLSIQRSFKQQTTVLWKSSVSKTETWTFVDVPFGKVGRFQMVIVAHIGDVNDLIAIDEVDVYHVAQEVKPAGSFDCRDGVQANLTTKDVCNFVADCKDERDEHVCGSCDFEIDSCGWSIIEDSQSRSTCSRVAASQVSIQSHPKIDHTFSKKAATGGHYILCTPQHSFGSKAAYLQGPSYKYKSASPTCAMFFWYATGTSGRTSFKVYFVVDDSYGLIYHEEKLRDIGNAWKRVDVSIGASAGDFQVEIYPDVYDYFAIDDVQFTNCSYEKSTKCSSTQVRCEKTGVCIDESALCDTVDDCGDMWDEADCNPLNSCTFQDDSRGCFWKPTSPTRGYQWYFTTSTTRLDSGPSVDHDVRILGEGKFAVTTNDVIGTFGNIAYLESEVFSTVDTKCEFRFFYYMFGKNIGTLDIQIRNLTTMEWGNSSWSKSGSIGQLWSKGVVAMPWPGRFQVRFKATTHQTLYNRIAVDDLSFSNNCTILPPSRFACSSGSPETVSQGDVCDFKSDCHDGSDERLCPPRCNFERGNICGWKQTTPNATVYYVTKASDGARLSSQVPKIDHTTYKDSGHYLLLMPKSILTSTLSSPTFQNSAGYCSLVFWISSKSEDAVTVSLKDASIGTEMFLWELNPDRNQSLIWCRVVFGLGRRRSKFFILITTIDIQNFVIDDLNFENCALPAKATSCPGQYQCKNKACVPNNRLCDLNDDCGDRSDETLDRCHAVQRDTFETAVSMFEPNTNEMVYRWDREVRTLDAETGPNFDHTYWNSFGHFMITKFTYPFVKDREAKLVTKLAFEQMPMPCVMTFYYYMYGVNVNQLGVYTQYYENVDDMNQRWTKLGNQGQAWFREQLVLIETMAFKVVIKALAPAGYNGQIAVDDISFSSDCK